MAKSRTRKTSSGRRPTQGGAATGMRRSRRGSTTMVFTQQNYMLLMIGVLAVVIGYTTMRIENQVDGIISLYVAPLLILGGYLEIIYAILWRPKPKEEPS